MPDSPFALPMHTPIMSWSSARMAWNASIPRWPPLLAVTMPTPASLAFWMAMSMALGPVMMPRPRSASMVAVATVSRRMRGWGRGFSVPSLYWAT